MAARSKRRALAFYFSIRICYMFLMPKCIRKSILGLRTTFVHAKRMPPHGADSRSKNAFGSTSDGSHHCAVVLFLYILKLYTDLDLTLLYILMSRTYGKFALGTWNASAWCLRPAAMLQRWLHVCRIKITLTQLRTNWFVSGSRDETPGGPEESRWTKPWYTYIRICVQSTHVYIYAKRRDEILD